MKKEREETRVKKFTTGNVITTENEDQSRQQILKTEYLIPGCQEMQLKAIGQ
jgi:hypothetical protein